MPITNATTPQPIPFLNPMHTALALARLTVATDVLAQHILWKNSFRLAFELVVNGTRVLVVKKSNSNPD
jgi:hypothetical protein